MGELLRRRAMMAQVIGAGPSPVECPYITDGLIFWLDGINQGSGAATWTDLVGGKVFELQGCTKGSNGVTFDGSTSFARTLGPISSDFATETLEIAFTNALTSSNFCLVCPVLVTVDGATKVGSGFITNSGGNYAIIRMDGKSTKVRFLTGVLSGENTISISDERCIRNGSAKTKVSDDYFSGNKTEYSYIGARTISGTLSKRFNGIMHSVRIYNRLLTEEEMLANQDVDKSRFGILQEV